MYFNVSSFEIFKVFSRNVQLISINVMLNDGMVHCFVHQKTFFETPSSILQCPTLVIFIKFYYYKVDGLGGYCKTDLILQNIFKV
jgi:hypothetical protein